MKTWLPIAVSSLVVLSLLMPAPPALAGTYKLATQIDVPGVPLESFDIGWVDATTQTYYLGDRSNAGIDIINSADNTFVARIGGFVGFRGKNETSGPDGIVPVPRQQELWAGDGNSTVKVVDLRSRTIVATIATGGSKRADELDYDEADDVILITNPDDDPPFVTFISTKTRTILGKLTFAEATDGVEQPVWSRVTKLYYLAVPETKTHPGGEVVVIDPKAMKVTAVFPVDLCHPHGLAFGPQPHLLLGCSSGKNARSIVMDFMTGRIVATITEVGGSDQVWYNPGDKRYYLAARANTGGPVLGIIDAQTNAWIENVPTVQNAHSVAVDPKTNQVFVPLTNKGIGVYKAGGGN
jgi:DNA-binding beta-propeller fold protein YncE